MGRRDRIAIWAIVVAGMLGLEGLAMAATKVDFSRYDVILTRKPFGEPPAEPVAPVKVEPPKPVAPPFTKTLRLMGITEYEGGIRVGILDITAKPPKTYFFELRDNQPENDVQDGLELLDAHFEDGWVLLRRNGIEEKLTMSGGDPGGEAPAAPAAPARTATVVPAQPMTPEALKLAEQKRLSYREQLKRRREEEQKRRIEPPKMTGEELEKHLRSYNLELIRAKGEKGPPLPIPLTAEEDDQLVKEGVLPPNP
jgi:hypothetical protein